MKILRRARFRLVAPLVSVLVSALMVVSPISVPAAGADAAAAVPTTGAPVPLSGSATTPDYVAGCPDRPAPGYYTCYSLHRTGFHPFTATPAGYGPADLQSAYALRSTTAGSGQTVYVIDAFGYPAAEDDLAVYRQQYGLGDCTVANGCFTKLDQRGNVPTDQSPIYNAGWAGETALDLDMVSAVCPKCHITLIEADSNNNDLFTAVDRANQLGARFVSMSWGGPEDGSEPAFDATYFGRTGVVYAASSGDRAYSAGVSYPSTSPNAVAVGGTSLRPSAGPGRHWTESVWDDRAHGYGPGSGCSADEAKPSWQAIVASSVCPRRAGNDVAAVADPDTGVAVYQLGSPYGDWSVSGGTSASAPIIAAAWALAGPPAGADHPGAYPYATAGALNDVTQGGNGSCSPGLLCTAAAGWDGPTGLGTPNGLLAFDRPTDAVVAGNPGDQVSPVAGPVDLTVAATSSTAAAVTFTAAGLPPGLSMSAAGRVTGSPTTVGSFAVTVTAGDTAGGRSAVHFSWRIAPAGTFVPIYPQRILDTRTGNGAPVARVPIGGSIATAVLGRGGVPGSAVAAVVLNVAVVRPDHAGFAAVYADGAARPATSNLNYVAGQTVSNMVVTRVGIGGGVRIYSFAAADYVADVVGYYLAGTPTAAGTFSSLSPARLLDTRTGTGAPVGMVTNGHTVTVQVTGRGGVPPGASAVVLDLAAVGAARSGWVSAYPDPAARPATSTVNFPGNADVPDLVMMPMAANGTITLYLFGGGTHLVADVFGYYTGGAAAVGGGFAPVTPARILDSRTGNGVGGEPLAVRGGDTLRVKVTGRGGVPETGVSAVVMNVAVTGAAGSGAGYLTVFAGDAARPSTSNLNYAANQTLANLVVVPVDAQGYVAFRVSGTTALLADVSGYFRA